MTLVWVGLVQTESEPPGRDRLRSPVRPSDGETYVLVVISRQTTIGQSLDWVYPHVMTDTLILAGSPNVLHQRARTYLHR